MSYKMAMERAGAEILAFQSFGSYQGDWLAKVKYEGRTYWVHGNYGSCSGCDAFQAEFGYDDREHCAEHCYEQSTDHSDCEACKQALKSYYDRLSSFGKCYLVRGEMTQEEAEKYASKHLEWDADAQEMLDFLKANAIKEGE